MTNIVILGHFSWKKYIFCRHFPFNLLILHFNLKKKKLSSGSRGTPWTFYDFLHKMPLLPFWDSFYTYSLQNLKKKLFTLISIFFVFPLTRIDKIAQMFLPSSMSKWFWICESSSWRPLAIIVACHQPPTAADIMALHCLSAYARLGYNLTAEKQVTLVYH